ncbi:MAG TPA: CBS domain-containing protein [Ktedonobacterales bacterium]
MLARDIMTHEVIAIDPNATVQDVARLLSDYHISGVPVLDEQRMVGIVTEADIIGKEGETVAQIMTPRVVSVREDTPVDEVAQILTSNRFKRVPVLRGERVVGIVSRANIVRMIASRWVCPICGAIQHGHMPQECFACGGDGAHFERELAPRMEISTRE